MDGYTARVLSELRADGLSLLAPLAADEAIAGMADYFMQRPVVGRDGRRRRLHELPEDATSASYDLETVVNCPGLVALANTPSVLQVVTAYLDCKPTVSSLGVRWALAGDGERSVFQNLHRDVDDWRFLKLFVYLTDVDEDSGPHCYIRTSHRAAFSWRAPRYRMSELVARFGSGNVSTVVGKRGTTFMADTLGIHCGGQVRIRPRLMLQIQYSMLPVFSFRYTPVQASVPPVDAYINRLVLRPPAADRPSNRQMREPALRS